MKDTLKSIARKVTLEILYEVVDERTREIKNELEKVHTRIDALNTRMDQQYDALNTRMEQQYMALNGRIDQLFSLFLQERKG